MTIKRWLQALAAVFTGWVAVLATVMIFSDVAPGAIVLLPSEKLIANLPEGSAVVAGGAGWVAIRSDAPKLGLTLYRAGGWLVLPAGLPGCLPLPAS